VTYRLYSYFRSSAAFRVRIALNHKGIPFETVPVHLLKDGGQQHTAEYRSVNPLGTVPVLEIPGTPPVRLAESMAIIQFLDELHPEKPLLPGTLVERAYIRWLAEIVNADIHPIQNLHVLLHLEKTYGADAEGKRAWAAHFIQNGFNALEKLLQQSAGQCCVGDNVTLADVYLVPQCFNARRFGVDLSLFPTLARVDRHLESLATFVAADPHHQPDTPVEDRRP